jgi:hypothetical protein
MNHTAKTIPEPLQWSSWELFPDPRKRGILIAPFGPGCYELRNGNQLVLFGRGKNTASRMGSLVPGPLGSGTRNNSAKKGYVLENIGIIEYRTLACSSPEEAVPEEGKLRKNKRDYLFPT